ncbi:MAG: hypothetical protein P8077_04990 [Gammaproteobacteria bacterium]
MRSIQALKSNKYEDFDQAFKCYAEAVRPFLQQHCIQCHGAKKAEGDLRLDTLPVDFDAHAESWVEVMDRSIDEYFVYWNTQ